MTAWKTTYGSQEEKPSEWDTTSSSSTVYQRKNIEAVDEDGKKWKYEERTMTADEMLTVRLETINENQNAIMEALASMYEEKENANG